MCDTDAFHSEIVTFIREHWLSNLAHNLSGPLSAARGYIRMTLRSTGSGFSEAHQRHLALALDNLDKLVLLVRGLETWPDLRNFEFTAFRIGDLLQEVLEEMRPSLGNGNIQIREQFQTECAITIADRAKLGAALEDFFAAAAGFAAPDGVLEISAYQKNGHVAIQLNAGTARPCTAVQPDLTAAARLWQSHGGSFSTSRTGNSWSLTCELPLMDFLRQQMLLSKKD